MAKENHKSSYDKWGQGGVCVRNEHRKITTKISNAEMELK
jgi:hypothetical protein